MITHINFGAMNPLQQHLFNKTGYADKEFIMTSEQFNMLVDEMMHKQAMQQEEQIEEEV